MKTFKIAIVLLVTCMLPVCMNARTGEETPAYRQKGYAGNIALTNWCFVFAGFETSHGYMFNEHHYLGLGFETHISPALDFVGVIEPFVEYKSYFLKRGSTPTASLRTGYCTGFFYNESEKPILIVALPIAFELNPSLGWDWGLKKGKGLSLNVGMQVLIADAETALATKVSFGFCF